MWKCIFVFSFYLINLVQQLCAINKFSDHFDIGFISWIITLNLKRMKNVKSTFNAICIQNSSNYRVPPVYIYYFKKATHFNYI
jgi:hypothetical protein